MIEQDGKVAIKYFQNIPHQIRIGSKNYLFMVKANICMCWINKGDVPTILAKTKTCCGGNRYRNVYKYANDLDVKRWMGLGER